MHRSSLGWAETSADNINAKIGKISVKSAFILVSQTLKSMTISFTSKDNS